MRAEIVNEARKWIGTRWQHQGRSTAGLDCVGLLIVIAHTLDLSAFDFRAYGRRPDGTRLVHHFDEQLQAVGNDARELGDALLLTERRFPCHCGILAERDGHETIIHAHAARRQVVEEPFTLEWRQRWLQTYRFP